MGTRQLKWPQKIDRHMVTTFHNESGNKVLGKGGTGMLIQGILNLIGKGRSELIKLLSKLMLYNVYQTLSQGLSLKPTLYCLPFDLSKGL